VRESERLYGFAVDAIVDEVRAEDDATSVLLVVGHEPMCSEMVAQLIGGGRVVMPTAALARVDFVTERWSGVAAGDGVLRWLVTPRLVAPDTPSAGKC
jgi:phosphohistidine phosphatase